MTSQLLTRTKLFLLVGLMLTVYSCEKPVEALDTLNPHPVSPPCLFEGQENSMDGYIDDTERSWMMDCFSGSYQSVEEIKASLLGDWELVGFGEGWAPSLTQPCGHITFDETTLNFDFENEFIDTTLATSWTLDSTFSLNVKGFKLVTDIDFTDALDLRVFCEEFIFHDATPSDGNMYIYRRI